jgi:hypothetical protein
MTGIVGNTWALDHFDPMETIPTSVGLTSYAGESSDFHGDAAARTRRADRGGLIARPGRQGLHIDDIVEAHRTMEADNAGGKIVVLT